jgi:hypothetical protein
MWARRLPFFHLKYNSIDTHNTLGTLKVKTTEMEKLKLCRLIWLYDVEAGEFF